ncbi:hypothetical protein [Chryseobacterium sp. SIMBA_038]|uniref:hypothetical protein n=1 Tax=Chryseobacterium sp. SIMBA_038 TaxID=3085780 RepID=UPI003978BD6F
MKNLTLLPGLLLLITATFSAQVGVNTADPKTTMDVSAKRDLGGNITDNTQIIGLQAPRLTRAELTANTGTYGTNQQGALIYITDITGGTATGQRINIDSVGYYSFDGSLWQKIKVSDINIYNNNGILTSNRTLTNNGFTLNFIGTDQSTSWSAAGGVTQRGFGTINKRASVILSSDDNNSNGVTSRMQLFQDPESVGQITATNDSRGLNIGSTGTTTTAPITFITSVGSNANGTEKMRINGDGNVAINISSPTERFDVNGNTRLRNLPLNGTANAIYTQSGGTASTTQDQTFTATRTVVADNNGVLGYVNSLPSDAGTSRALLITNAPGTQNVGSQFTPNAAIGQFTNESLDIYNAWNNNVFTVPANMGGVYIIVMQNSNTHVSTGTATPTWHTAAYYEKSTDGGTSWNTMIKHTYADLAGTIVDNGNTLYWTGFLNVGDQVRVRFSCNATTNNIVNYGGLSITKLAQ